MKKIIKIIVTILGIVVGGFLLLYFSGINDTPRYDNKTVIDIRNQTNQLISGMYLSVVVPDTFTIPEGSTYYDGNIIIPDIEPYERVIVVLNQKKVAVEGMKLQLTYNDYKALIVDELQTNEIYGNIGSMHIIHINNNWSIQSKEVYNYLLQKNDMFYYKRYSRIIEL